MKQLTFLFTTTFVTLSSAYTLKCIYYHSNFVNLSDAKPVDCDEECIEVIYREKFKEESTMFRGCNFGYLSCTYFKDDLYNNEGLSIETVEYCRTCGTSFCNNDASLDEHFKNRTVLGDSSSPCKFPITFFLLFITLLITASVSY